MSGSILVGAVALAAVVFTVRAASGELLARAETRAPAVAWCLTLALLAVLPLKLALWTGGVRSAALCSAALLSPLAILGVRRALYAGSMQLATSWAPLLATVGMGAALLQLTWTTYLWDEGSTHFGVPSAMARGVFPPVHPLFPEEPFSYHLGYDVLVALLRAFLHLTPERSCDVVTSGCVLLVLALLARVGRTLAGERGAALAIVIGLLGAGTAAVCLADGWGIGLACSGWFPASWVGATRLPPPVISSFFQHPQGLGMPLSLAALWLALHRPGAGRLALSALLVVLLSQVQVVFFLLSAGGIAAGLTLRAWRARAWQGAAFAWIAMGTAVLLGRAVGGLAGEGGALLRFESGYFAERGALLLAHNLALLGLGLVAPLVVWWRRKAPDLELRVGLLCMTVVALVFPNIAHYQRSWDVVKFFAVGAFFANVLLADGVAALWQRARVLAAVVLLLSTLSGAVWLLRSGPLNGVVAPAYREAPPSVLAQDLDRKFGAVIGGARVLSGDPSIHQLGFLVVGHDWRKAEQGYTLDRARAEQMTQKAEQARRTLDPALLREMDVGFVLLSARDRKKLEPQGTAVLGSGALEPLGVAGPRDAFTLYRVRGAP